MPTGLVRPVRDSNRNWNELGLGVVPISKLNKMTHIRRY